MNSYGRFVFKKFDFDIDNGLLNFFSLIFVNM